MPAKQTGEFPDITIISDNQSSQAEESPSTANIDPEITATADVKYGDGITDEKADKPKTAEHQQFRHRSAAAWSWHINVPPKMRTKPQADNHERTQIQYIKV